jgi:hypothetical protein
MLVGYARGWSAHRPRKLPADAALPQGLKTCGRHKARPPPRRDHNNTFQECRCAGSSLRVEGRLAPAYLGRRLQQQERR